MQKTLPFICLILIFSCQRNKIKDPKSILKSMSILTSNSNKVLIGTWEICGYSSAGNQISFNACPTITFQNNDWGFIKRFDAQILPFHWRIEGKKLIFNNSVTGDNLLNTGIYEIKIITYSSLTLSDSTQDVTYQLGKNE